MNLTLRHFFNRDTITRYNQTLLRTFRYVFGLDAQWRDARPAQLALGITRIALFVSLAWMNKEINLAIGDIATFAQARAEGAYTAFGLLMLYGDKPPSPAFWEAVYYVSWVSTFMAIIGLCTRPAMIVSTLSVMLIAMLDASPFFTWSHGYNVNFLAAIPFMFAQAGQSMSLDKLIARYWKGYWFAPQAKPIFWAVLSVQYSAALFYFGAFWAKFVVSNGGIDYIFSDNMRHILAVTWLAGYKDITVPWHIDLIASTPALWMFVAAAHLVMQAVVILVVISVQRPYMRLLEGVNYSISAVGLYFVMAVFDPWWLLLLPAFIDWDYFAARFARLPNTAQSQPSFAKPRIAVALLAAFFATYCWSFIAAKADRLKLYPFSDMSMYAAVYAMKPYDQHLPYVDIMRGRMVVELPDSRWRLNDKGDWVKRDTPVTAEETVRMGKTFLGQLVIKQTDKTLDFRNISTNYHWLAREMDLTKLENSMKEFIPSLNPPVKFPSGSRLIVRGETVAFSAYPKPFGQREIFHSGVRGVVDLDSGKFVGASPVTDILSRTITINGKGVIRGIKVLGSAKVLTVPTPEPYEEIEGKWLDANRFEISQKAYKKYQGTYVNLLIQAETDLGKYDFDGQIVYW